MCKTKFTSMPFLAFATVAYCVLTGAAARGENRTYDGTLNNLLNPNWGTAGTQLVRMAPSAYADGLSAPAGASRPNPRLISNAVVAQHTMMPNTHHMTDWVFQWGQFIDHDLDLTVGATPTEALNVPIPAGDPIFDPGNTGTAVMSFDRSNYDPATGTVNPRQQINSITSYLDASMVYGSDLARANALRTMSGGKMKTSAGNLLPLNTMGLENATGGPVPPEVAEMFYAGGDVRANEQVGLTATHTLFVREHNRLADAIAAANPLWDDEQIYQRARKLVGGEIQAITFNEFLPALLGSHAPSIQNAYDPNVNASIFTEFSTALYRVGHTMLPPRLMRMENDGTEADGGHMSLRHAFFLPSNLAGPNELDYLLKGLASEEQQEVDMHLVDDVRNFLFGDPVPGGFDLATLNIQRGRDHGLPDYNSLRVAFGLPAVASFADITSNMDTQLGLQALYGDVNNIDAWVGALSEDHLPGSAVGELITYGLLEQFTRIRDGDRLWFLDDEDLSDDDIAWLMSRRLSEVIKDNTGITNIQANVFFMAVPEPSTLGLLATSLVAGGLWYRRGRTGSK